MGCASGSSLSAPHPTSFRRQRCPTRPPLRIAPRITACERADEKFDLGQRTLGRTAVIAPQFGEQGSAGGD